MVSVVPVEIDKSPIISLVSNYLLLSNHVAFSVLILTLTDGENFLGLFTSERRLSVAIDSDWRPHILENNVICTWHSF
jgi:hypothetical protein